MRKSAALLLIMIAALLTFPAALAAWEQRVLMNEDGFVDLGNEVLKQDAVQEALATEVADGVASVLGPGLLGGANSLLGASLGNDLTSLLGSLLGPELGGKPQPGAKPGAGSGAEGNLIQPIALEVIRELPDSEISDGALELTHEALVITVRKKILRPEEDAIVLDLSSEVKEVLEVLEIKAPASLPTDAGKIVLLDPTDLATVFRLARWFDGRATFLVALPLLLLAAAIFIAPDRRLATSYAGGALAASAVLWIVLVKFGFKAWITDKVAQDDSDRAVAHASYDVIANSFVRQELVVLAAGIVILVLGVALTYLTARGSSYTAARTG